jgi:hypothetical protein
MQLKPTVFRAFWSTEEHKITHIGHPSDDRLLRTLLNFYAALTAGSSTSSILKMIIINYLRCSILCFKIKTFQTQLISFESLVQVAGDVYAEDEYVQLPRDLQQFAFSKFSSVYFADGGQLSPKKHPITRPFLSKAAVRYVILVSM